MALNEFFKTERNLDKVVRFSNQTRIKDESVAEHSFHASVYAMILADMEIAAGNEVNMEKVLRCCLIHDLEESMTGDILHGFKYSDPELLKNMKKMGAEFYRNIVGDLPGEMPGKYVGLWEQAKEDTIEGRIVEASDKLEALMYSIDEYSMGNRNFKPMIDSLVETLGETELGSVRGIMKELKLPE